MSSHPPESSASDWEKPDDDEVSAIFGATPGLAARHSTARAPGNQRSISFRCPSMSSNQPTTREVDANGVLEHVDRVARVEAIVAVELQRGFGFRGEGFEPMTCGHRAV